MAQCWRRNYRLSSLCVFEYIKAHPYLFGLKQGFNLEFHQIPEGHLGKHNKCKDLEFFLGYTIGIFLICCISHCITGTLKVAIGIAPYLFECL